MSGFRTLSRLSTLSVVVLLVGVFVTFVNIYQLRALQNDMKMSVHADQGCEVKRPTYTVYGKHPDSGYLKHVYNVFNRAGFLRVNYTLTDDWDVMWAHDYPFKKIRPVMKKLKPHQRVNKLPGSGYVTNKVNLATSEMEHIPKAFRIPNETKALLAYVKDHPDKMFVQKDKNHRGIKIEKIENLDLKSDGSFIQEFVDDPFLIDGYKFDIGVYTMITSIDPLRIHVFEGDALIRFCPEKYHPFDPAQKDKYVVHDDYRPTWKVPTLAKLYSDLGYSFKETLNAHIRSLDKDPSEMWQQIHNIITDVYLSKEKSIIKSMSYYEEVKRSFFEMVRFDFVLDSNLRVYLMEANMSPNLSSAHFSSNRLLYEQVVFSLLRLVNVVRGGVFSDSMEPRTKEEEEMQVADKDLTVFADSCVSQRCSKPEACLERECFLCKGCVSDDERRVLRQAFLEHNNRHQSKRIFPPPVTKDMAVKWRETTLDDVSDNNKKMHMWYLGKCLADDTWCV